jgi:carbamoyltransferase
MNGATALPCVSPRLLQRPNRAWTRLGFLLGSIITPIETVNQETNPRFHTLLRRFKEIPGCPVLVNTSFNVRGEPIVCDVNDAFRCFMGTEIETLVVGNCILEKYQQNPALKLDYKDAFELD